MDDKKKIQLLSAALGLSIGLTLRMYVVMGEELHDLSLKNKSLFNLNKLLLDKVLEEAPTILADPEIKNFLIDWEFDNIASILKEEM